MCRAIWQNGDGCHRISSLEEKFYLIFWLTVIEFSLITSMGFCWAESEQSADQSGIVSGGSGSSTLCMNCCTDIADVWEYGRTGLGHWTVRMRWRRQPTSLSGDSRVSYIDLVCANNLGAISARFRRDKLFWLERAGSRLVRQEPKSDTTSHGMFDPVIDSNMLSVFMSLWVIWHLTEKRSLPTVASTLPSTQCSTLHCRPDIA